MGGGKSRAGCEEVFDVALDYPGCVILVARAAHTSIINTTKKTMAEVIPSYLISRRKESAGEDWVELWNGSRIHFIGLDDPYRWYSSEIGFLFFDEAQEIEEEKVVRLMTRLRQVGMPHRTIITFNPSSPGHWLQEWFLLGETEPFHEQYEGEPKEGGGVATGFYKPKLYASEATSPIGDAHFTFARATDNAWLPEGYVEETLSGLPERLRRRLLEGLWEFTEGNLFFDPESLSYHQKVVAGATSVSGRTQGDPEEDFLWRREKRKAKMKDPIRVQTGDGPLLIFKPPKKPKKGERDGVKGRYVVAVDTSSGGAFDFSAIQVISIDDFEQVAEFQGMVKPPDLARIAYQLGRIYNDALIVPEITGGWGFTVQEELRRMHYPNQFTRPMYDRLAKQWTDKLGWETTEKSRAHMLDTLERVLREQEFGMYSHRTMIELSTFVYGKNDKPMAQVGCRDDLVVSLAIGVTVALQHPRKVTRVRPVEHKPQFAATGY